LTCLADEQVVLTMPCRPNFYHATLHAMHWSHRIFFGHAISRKRLETGIYFHWVEKCLLSNGTILVTLDDPHTNIPNSFTVRRYTIARYILCYGPVLVRPSVWLGAERPHNAKSCRGTHVATSSSMRPIATDVQLWHGQSI